jgi:hypothetical protein
MIARGYLKSAGNGKAGTPLQALEIRRTATRPLDMSASDDINLLRASAKAGKSRVRVV